MSVAQKPQPRCDGATTGVFLPSPLKPGYWNIKWNIDYKPIFSPEKVNKLAVISRSVNNFPMQCGIMIPALRSLLWQLGRQNTFPFC